MSTQFEQVIGSIRLLPAPDREKIRQWLDSEGQFADAGPNGYAESANSVKSLAWIGDNCERFLGQWVALDGDRLIASGSTAKEVYAKAKAEGVKTPFVELVTVEEPGPHTGGWLS